MSDILKNKLLSLNSCPIPTQPDLENKNAWQRNWSKIKPYLLSCTTIRIALVAMILAALLSSCASVAPYERAYLNDEEMDLQKMSCAELEAYFQVIREGASGADGGKTGGGCGCN